MQIGRPANTCAAHPGAIRVGLPLSRERGAWALPATEKGPGPALLSIS